MRVNISGENGIKKIHKAKTEIEGEMYNSTIIIGDFNILLLMMDRTTIQKVSKDTEDYRKSTRLLKIYLKQIALHRC